MGARRTEPPTVMEEPPKVNYGTFGGRRTKNHRTVAMEDWRELELGGVSMKRRTTALSYSGEATKRTTALSTVTVEEQEQLATTARRLSRTAVEWTNGVRHDELPLDDGEVKFTSLFHFELN